MRAPRWTLEEDMRLVDLFTSGMHTRAIAVEMGRGYSGILNRTRHVRSRGFLNHLITVKELAVIFGREHSGMVRMVRSGSFGPPVVIGNKYAWALEAHTLMVWCQSEKSFGVELGRMPPSKWRTMIEDTRRGYEVFTPKEYALRFNYSHMHMYGIIRSGRLRTVPHVGGRGREYKIIVEAA